MRLVSLGLVLALGFNLLPVASSLALSPHTLIKGSGSTIYYYAKDGQRYVFPNYATFASWYPEDTRPEIVVVNTTELASIPLGGNVTYRPGVRLIKVTTDSKVYAVSRYGVLHWLTTEAMAIQLYGAVWNKQISDVPDVFFTNYTIGAPITSREMYNPLNESLSVATLQDNLFAPTVYSPAPYSTIVPPSPLPAPILATTISPTIPTPTTSVGGSMPTVLSSTVTSAVPTFAVPISAPIAATITATSTTPATSSIVTATTSSITTIVTTPAFASASSSTTPVTTSPLTSGFALSSSNPLSCTSSKTLESLMTCSMSHFGLFVAPNEMAKTDFRTVTHAMLDGSCDSITLPASLIGIYAARSFTDNDTSKTYCVLMEIKDADGDGAVDRGWGSVIVNNAPTRELNIAIMHPMDDWKTEEQGIGIFKASNSRSFFVAGARRYVGKPSACQPDYAHSSSDAAHNTALMLFAATQEIDAWYGSRRWHQLQFHGMGSGACSGVDVYITNGKNLTPASGDVSLKLKVNILKEHPTWSVNVPGDSPGCSLSATTNVQGRFLNGVSADAVCATSATAYSQKFFSLEQAPGFRQAADWIAVVNSTW